MGPAAPALTPGFFDKQHDYFEVNKQNFFPEVTECLQKRVNFEVSQYMQGMRKIIGQVESGLQNGNIFDFAGHLISAFSVRIPEV